MITDSLLQLFVRTLGAHKHVKRSPITRFDWEAGGVPADVGRVLTAVGGWRYGNLRFTEPSQLDADREARNHQVEELEAGRSDDSNHAFWNRAWYPLFTTSLELHAFDPIGCFGGAPGQVVAFDVEGGDTWRVFPSISIWINALIDGFESEGKEALALAYAWARANKGCVEVKFPQTLDEQRSSQRFDAGIGQWLEMQHPDGRRWAVRQRRDGYELRIGAGEDAVIRRRSAPNPSAELRRLVREQKAEGFIPST